MFVIIVIIAFGVETYCRKKKTRYFLPVLRCIDLRTFDNVQTSPGQTATVAECLKNALKQSNLFVIVCDPKSGDVKWTQEPEFRYVYNLDIDLYKATSRPMRYNQKHSEELTKLAHAVHAKLTLTDMGQFRQPFTTPLIISHGSAGRFVKINIKVIHVSKFWLLTIVKRFLSVTMPSCEHCFSKLKLKKIISVLR